MAAPQRPIIPQASIRFKSEVTRSVPLACWVRPIAHRVLLFGPRAYSSAASRMRSAGTPVIFDATSGVMARTDSRSLSKAWVRRAMNVLASSPLAITWLSIALNSATSVPGCICRWMSARPASSVLRGSATMSVAPRSWARLIAAPKTGWDSVVFAPAMKMTSAACSTSRIEPDAAGDVVGAQRGAEHPHQDVVLLVAALGRREAGEGVAAALPLDAHQLLRRELQRLVPRGLAERLVPRRRRRHPVAQVQVQSLEQRQIPHRLADRPRRSRRLRVPAPPPARPPGPP